MHINPNIYDEFYIYMYTILEEIHECKCEGITLYTLGNNEAVLKYMKGCSWEMNQTNSTELQKAERGSKVRVKGKLISSYEEQNLLNYCA